MTEKELLIGIRDGKEDAFKSLVEQNKDMVVNVCYGFLNNYEDALDVAQNVFVKIYQSIHTFKAESKLSTWIYRIAVNQSLNYRRNKNKKGIFQSLDLLFNNPGAQNPMQLQDHLPQEQDELEAHENKKLLYNALDKLPDKQRTALSLTQLQELSYKEVAGIMNINTSEVGVLINRAKKNLQKKLLKLM
jgi:RNA polymerase sigma-70 factor (ECF subfamily)